MAYRDLPIRERAALIKQGVANGLRRLPEIEEAYNSYAEGGNMLPEIVVTAEYPNAQRVWDTVDKSNTEFFRDFEDGGHLYGFGDWLSRLFGGNNEKPVPVKKEEQTASYTRMRNNDSPTRERSEELEDRMNENLKGHNSSYDHKWDIPYIEDKEIRILGNRVSSNALDSLAKYAEVTGVPIEEAVGLAMYESTLGGTPFINYKDYPENATQKQKAEVDAHNRALGNSSFFRNYGYIPAWALVRDNEYITEGYEKTKAQKAKGMPPLEHSLWLYKSGKYNPGLGDGVHTKEVKAKAAKLKSDPGYLKWLSTYKKHSTGGPLYPFSFNKQGLPEVRY